jgi:hypothetical protein
MGSHTVGDGVEPGGLDQVHNQCSQTKSRVLFCLSEIGQVFDSFFHGRPAHNRVVLLVKNKHIRRSVLPSYM